jgi:MarR family transcriptional regulator, 2-MHQ and catechol-resistance regulon repressor
MADELVDARAMLEPPVVLPTPGAPAVDPVMAQWREIGASYARNHRQLIHGIEAFGVQGQWFEVLIKLLDAPDRRLTMSRLAAGIAMTSGGLTKLIDRLEQAGFAERQSDRSDRRIVHAALTPTGVLAASSAVDSYSRGLQAVMTGSVTVDEIARTGALMARLQPKPEPTPV